MKAMTKSVLALSLLTIGSAQAFELSSKDIQEGHPMAKTFEYNSWGCDGGNHSPQLMDGKMHRLVQRALLSRRTTQMRQQVVAFGIGLHSISRRRSVSYLVMLILLNWVVKNLASIMERLVSVAHALQKLTACTVTNLRFGHCQQIN